ncbi:TetR/AcrR family transcriptional regulator [Arthrobacter antioxidans]|uniref:TetR/AcrR family transcriptional regulator n=1 Tax=Arthrobacter antioxidans TaxID=2895818 RepID=UPI001FFF4BE1|nr:TetR/AcrR family transcriptional regulator [Arthrobacter antioxidans]
MTPSAAERILEAVQDLLVSRGIEEVTIRTVAATAGVSVGAVQHHHRTKDDLLMAAMDKVSEEFVQRVESVTDRGADPASNLAAVCRILGGVDDASRSASIVWLAYASKATTSETVAVAHQESWRLMEDGLTALLHEVDPALGRDDAATLMALLDGIAIARATETERMTSQRAHHIISTFLGRLAPPTDAATP